MKDDKFLYLFIWLCFLSAIVQIIVFIVMVKRDINNKKVHRLYRVLYEVICDKEYVGSLCGEIKNLKKITPKEIDFLYKHFKSQKPNFFKNRVFYFNKSYKGKVYWWNSYSTDISTEQRKMFIKMLVDKTSLSKSKLIDIV
jgi:hypothetical protein